MFQHQTFKNLKEAVERNIPKTSTLTPQDLIIAKVELNYGMKDQNPVELVYFYNKNSPKKTKKIKQEESILLPERFVLILYFTYRFVITFYVNILITCNITSAGQ